MVFLPVVGFARRVFAVRGDDVSDQSQDGNDEEKKKPAVNLLRHSGSVIEQEKRLDQSSAIAHRLVGEQCAP